MRRGGGRRQETDEDCGHVVAADARLRAVRREAPHQELLADLRKQRRAAIIELQVKVGIELRKAQLMK